MPSPSQEQASTYAGLYVWLQTHVLGWNEASEADFHNMLVETPTGFQGTTPPTVFHALMEIIKNDRTIFENVSAPSLAIFSDDRYEHLISETTQSNQQASIDIFKRLGAFHHNGARNFRLKVKNGTVVELRDTDHACFIQREAEVARLMREFLASH